MSPAPVPLPPGPNSFSAWQLFRYSHSPLSFLETCAARFGNPFTVRWAGYGKFVMLCAPDAVRDVFRAEPHELHSGEGNEFLSVVVGKNSVLVLDDQAHARQRRLLLPPLKGDRMRGFFDAIQSATLNEANSWPLDKPIRMVEPMQRITLRVIAQVVLGLTPGPESEDFEVKVSRMLSFGRGRYTLIWAKLIPSRLLSGSRFIPYFRQMRELDEAIFAFIGTLRRQPLKERRPSVLADLLVASHDDGSPLGDREIRDAIVTILVAGHDTTALALAWALEQIVPRADVLERICGELNHATDGGGPRAEHLDKLEYLDAAIRESLRLRTILPFVVRLTKQVVAIGGREYPPGIVLCPCSHLVHRRPDLYPDPHTFQPERFLTRRFAGHEFFPFGGGNRTCLGMGFALYEMKVVLSTLFRHLHLSRPSGAVSRAVRRGIALAPDDGALISVSRRAFR